MRTIPSIGASLVGSALEIDGPLKTEFSTKTGIEHGAIELERRFPMQIRISYDANTDFPA
jgi:hypothetical protein